MREIKLAQPEQLEEIMGIYAYAQKFMAEHGNPTQWESVYPPRDLIEMTIDQKKCYVCMDGDKMEAVFYFAKEEDEPAYRQLESGEWLNDRPYGVVHRIASAQGTHGAASFCLNWAFEQCGNLKIDTHDDNQPMQNLLTKLGFVYCGKLKLEEGDSREDFQKNRNPWRGYQKTK
ncbi:GNAT family N-acetyltransferase [Brotaphodocola sp.]|uniref:GNAT family N-acetyltransferase n=1 Tax=Brotaphodocola sp. TaxID=3073577 RepID=UPI003D7C9701